MDFSNYKFRCSALSNLMTRPRAKTEVLSETCKTYLRDIWIAETFGRIKPDIGGVAAKKGIIVESDSLGLYQNVKGETYFKNQQPVENEFIKGTPDVIADDFILDVKSSWNLWTFANVDYDLAHKTYFWQVFGYMWLCNKKKASLVYALVNTPESIANDELYRLSFKFGDDEVEKFRNNYLFDDIDPKLRIKHFSFDFDESMVELLKEKIVASREYLNGLSL